MQILWKKIIIAGVAGWACGQLYRHFKEHPNPELWAKTLPIVQGSLAAGVCGSALGLAVAAYRNIPSHVYAFSVGGNFAVATSVFLGIRVGALTLLQSEADKQVLFVPPSSVPSREYIASCISGGVTGMLLSILSRYSFASVALSGIGGMAVGVSGQFGYNCFESWRKHKAIELYYPELVSEQKPKVEWTLEAFQNRFLGFWHQYSRSSQVEERLVMLEAMLEEERAKITELDRLLALQESRQDSCTIDK